MRRKTCRSHIILLIEGRLFLLIALGMILLLYFLGISEICKNPTSANILDGCLFIVFATVLMTLFGVVVCPFLWAKCFEKLIITDKFIEWRCLFMKTRRIPLPDIRYANIIAFKDGNIVKYDLYHSGFLSILLSSDPPPRIRIDKTRCSDTLIKFGCTEKVCRALAEALPEPMNRIFVSEVRQYESGRLGLRRARIRAKRRKSREKARKKAKK